MKQIPRSLLGAAGIGQLDVAAAAYAHELRQWRAHMARVAADETSGVPPAERHVAYPAPRAHELVESAVDDDGNVSFGIVEDGPTPEQALAASKRELMIRVTLAEQAAIALVVPVGKRRLFNLREAEIRAADAERAKNLAADHEETVRKVNAEIAAKIAERDKKKPGIASLAKKGLDLIRQAPEAEPLPAPPPHPDIHAEVAKARPPEDTRHLADQHDRRERIAAIERTAAQALHDIEDLTAETIGAWKIPDFN